MQYPTLLIDSLLATLKQGVLLDVRTPKEYEKGHLPGAISFPIFSNEERHLIGIAYKQEGSKIAFKMGLDAVGPKLTRFVEEAETLANGKQIFIYCWRGGMRSNSMALLLKTAGLDVAVLHKGYKAYRNWALKRFDIPLKLINLGGYTGTGKTEVLHELSKQGQQIIDLEGLANHKGSAFGNLMAEDQPTSEQFENDLAFQLNHMDISKPIFIEDESHNIGRVNLPNGLFQQLQEAPLVFLQKQRDNRVKMLKPSYGQANKKQAKSAFQRIERRLGGADLKKALEAIEMNDASTAIDIALNYYDRYYYKALEKRNFSHMLKLDADCSVELVANKLMEISKKLYSDV